MTAAHERVSPEIAPRPAGQADPAAGEAAPARRGGARMAWLDALRGFAALCVVFDHLGYWVLQPIRHDVYQWFNPGWYGVCVFFLVSGYIVPASLERKGSVRTFWVSRVFRLYPLYLFALLAAFLLWQFGLGSLDGANHHMPTAAFAHALMLSNVLGRVNAIYVVWTLSYEMAFYLLLTALFVTGVHRRSSRYALGFAAAVAVIGGVLPNRLLSLTFGPAPVAATADLVIIAAVVLAATRHRIGKRAGAVVAGVAAVVLVTCNGTFTPPWQALTIMALMFTGTMLQRAERGEYSKRLAAVVTLAVFALVVGGGLWQGQYWHSGAALTQWQRQWVTSLVLAGATFALGMAYRHKHVPRPLAWLGLVSYSVYVLHPLLIELYKRIPFTRGPLPLPTQVLLTTAFVAVLLGCCALTYRLLEAPMQQRGRALARWLDARFGQDRVPALAGAGLAVHRAAPVPSPRPPALTPPAGSGAGAVSLRRFPFHGDGVIAAVTTRHGGVSSGRYASLNLGDHVGDDHAAVLENRRRLCAKLGVGRLTVADQQDRAQVAVIGPALAGRGHEGVADARRALPRTDAMVTDRAGVALTVMAADCAPVVLFDPARHAIGVANCGLDGAVLGVLPATIGVMNDAFGSRPEDLLVGIGPAIGAGSYGIGAAEAAAVTAAFGDGAELYEAGVLRPAGPGRCAFDLTTALRIQLREVGVGDHNVHPMGVDTRASAADFFSGRAASPCGRFMAVAALRA